MSQSVHAPNPPSRAWTEKRAIGRAVKNDKAAKRFTRLADRLRE